MSTTIVNKKVTFPFAHESEKSYQTLVPRVSSWYKNIRKIQVSASPRYHDETL